MAQPPGRNHSNNERFVAEPPARYVLSVPPSPDAHPLSCLWRPFSVSLAAARFGSHHLALGPAALPLRRLLDPLLPIRAARTPRAATPCDESVIEDSTRQHSGDRAFARLAPRARGKTAPV